MFKTMLTTGGLVLMLCLIWACSSPNPTPTERVSVLHETVVSTSTLTPTAVATVTPTPVPTATPRPTPTPAPTLEPTATPRPTPTPTPRPTPSPTPRPLPITLTLDCGDEMFIQDILDLSQDQDVAILKMYTGAEEVRRSDEFLECRGEAKLSNGFDALLVYYYEIDRDGDTFYGYLVEEYIPTPTPPHTLTPVHTPTPEPPPALGSRENPVPFGTTVEVKGEETTDHWEITVLGTTPDATAIVLSKNPYNDPPEEGNQFYIVRVQAKYLGPDSTEFWGSYRLRALGAGGVVYTTFEHSCGVIPDELPDPELFAGGTVEGNVCWQISSGDADSLMVFLEPEGYSDRNRTWFSLHPSARSPSS